ncbi:MAG: UDP-N-acetylmuramoyl-tripeptide--D-alanyl-D-alanine ligase, partial [Eubacteriales bacterium]
MKQLTLKQIAQWCGGTVEEQYENIVVEEITTDSRDVKPGFLFIPLPGTKVDGHNYIRRAIQSGAVACLSQKEGNYAGAPIIQVKDTLVAFGEIAKGYRMERSAFVLAITGSVGKTTTKEMVATMMRQKYKTIWTEGNHNNNLGLPMTVVRVDEDTEVAVLELGMNHFGEMSYLSKIAKPNLAIINNIGTMHIENLGSREGILRAKMEILDGMDEEGVLILNGDEPLLWNMKEELLAKLKKVYYYGIENKECDILATNIDRGLDGVRFSFVAEGKEAVPVFIPANGQHTIYNALGAITAGMMAKLSREQIQIALSNFENTGSRQKIYEAGGYTIIEDCYNAGPESMAAALAVLGEMKNGGRRIAVLGDMLELGSCSTAEHYRVGRLALENADLLFAYGVNANRVVTGAVTGGMNPKMAMFFDDQDGLIHQLRAKARKGDVLLFKGSRGMKME